MIVHEKLNCQYSTKVKKYSMGYGIRRSIVSIKQTFNSYSLKKKHYEDNQ